MAEIRCGKCGRSALEHCSLHMTPCCPGKCPGPSTTLDGFIQLSGSMTSAALLTAKEGAPALTVGELGPKYDPACSGCGKAPEPQPPGPWPALPGFMQVRRDDGSWLWYCGDCYRGGIEWAVKDYLAALARG